MRSSKNKSKWITETERRYKSEYGVVWRDEECAYIGCHWCAETPTTKAIFTNFKTKEDAQRFLQAVVALDEKARAEHHKCIQNMFAVSKSLGMEDIEQG